MGRFILVTLIVTDILRRVVGIHSEGKRKVNGERQ